MAGIGKVTTVSTNNEASEQGQLGKAFLQSWRRMLSACGIQGKAVNVLSLFVPFSVSARGSDRKPVLTFRYGWAKVIRKIQGQQADGVICLR